MVWSNVLNSDKSAINEADPGIPRQKWTILSATRDAYHVLARQNEGWQAVSRQPHQV